MKRTASKDSGAAAAPSSTAAPSSASASSGAGTTVGWTRLPSSSLFRTDSMGLAMDPSYEIMYGNVPLRSPAYTNGGMDGMSSYFAVPTSAAAAAGATPSASGPAVGDGASGPAPTEAAASGAVPPATRAGRRGTDGWRARSTPSVIALPAHGLKPVGVDNLSLLPSPALNTPTGMDGFPPTVGSAAARRPVTRSSTDVDNGMGDVNEKDSASAASILQAISSPQITTEENLFEKNMTMLGLQPVTTAGAAASSAAAGQTEANSSAAGGRSGPSRGRSRVVEVAAHPASLPSLAAAPRGGGYFPTVPQGAAPGQQQQGGSSSGGISAAAAMALWPNNGVAWPPTLGGHIEGGGGGGVAAGGSATTMAAIDGSGHSAEGGSDGSTGDFQIVRVMPRKRKGEQEDLEMLEQKRMRRRERCREAATKFRVKKRNEVQELEQQAAAAQIAHAQLVQEVNNLRQRVIDLKAFTLQHRECAGIAQFNWTTPKNAAA